MLNISCVTGDLSVLIYFTETLVFCAWWEESPWFKTVWLSVCVFRRGACDSSTCVHWLKVDAFMRSVEVGGGQTLPCVGCLVGWFNTTLIEWFVNFKLLPMSCLELLSAGTKRGACGCLSRRKRLKDSRGRHGEQRPAATTPEKLPASRQTR